MKTPVLAALLSLASCDSGSAETTAPAGEEAVAQAGSETLATNEGAGDALEATAVDVGAATAGDTAAFADATRRFTAALWQQLRRQEGNLAVSPASIEIALAMTWAGARGQTAAQMARTMHFGDDAQAIHRAAHAQLESWNDPERDAYQLRVASRLFAQASLPLVPDFVGLTRDAYGAPIEPLDFRADPERGRVHINRWVEVQTNDRIEDLLPPGAIDSSTSLVLTNAIYFHGSWRTRFPETETRGRAFRLTGGGERSVPTMQLTGQRFGYARAGDVQLLELPYVGEELSMVVVLPTARDGLSAVEATLDAERLATWTSAPRVQRVDVYLPRFRIDPPSSMAMKSLLQAMGMVLAFRQGAADFTAMSDPPQVADRLHIGDVFHKAFVEVNEEGTEAAAATAVVMARGAGPGAEPPVPTFRADHPFLFLLRDVRSGAILFIGRVADPR